MGLSGADIERLYRRQARRMLLWLTRETLDAEVALDLVAETYATAFAERRRFRGRSDEEAAAWVWGIARHRLQGYWRRGSVERRALARLGVERPPLAEEEVERIEELAGVDDLRRRVARAMERLPGEQREALRLRIVEELPYEEVCRRLAITPESARARVSRGLRRLSGALTGDVPDEATGMVA